MQAKLDKIIIFCADVERLVHFYRDHFGFSILGDTDKTWTVLDTGQTQIAFHKIGDQYLSNSEAPFQADSNVKLVFQIDEDLGLFRKNLLENKVDLDEIKQFPGYPYRTCDGRDPEGNVFQFVEYL